MRFEPGTRVIDDPGLAERVSGVRMAGQMTSYETAEDLATLKRMQAQVGALSSPAQPTRSSRTPTREEA